MGKRGPQPDPTPLKIVKGERADRINDAEPQPTDGDVAPPAWLSSEAKKVWGRYAPDLERKGVLTAWDVEAFAGFCDAVVRRSIAAKRIAEEGEVVEVPVFSRKGDLVGHRLERNQWSYALKDADAQIQKWGARFGLTPSERSQIVIRHEGSADDGEDLLTG